MGFIKRLANGWKLSLISFQLIDSHKELLLFPLLSTISLLGMGVSFIFCAGSFSGGYEGYHGSGSATQYLLLLAFYLINAFVTIFFNVALIHCTFKILKGEQATISEGVAFSSSRLNLILSWSLVSATVNVVLKLIEKRSILLTGMITRMFGMLWSLATFLVIPVMVYENLDVGAAIKRSAQLFKETWGENVAAGFSFEAIGFIIFLASFICLGSLMLPNHWFLYLAVMVLVGSIIYTVISAVETVFLAMMYQYATKDPVEKDAMMKFGDVFK